MSRSGPIPAQDACSRATAVQRAAGELHRAGVEQPRRTAELLLAAVLGTDRIELVTHPERPLEGEAAARFAAAVARRAAGVPLQYVTGRREFYGLEFEVSPDVLIPRPETELVVERALEAGRLASRRGELRFADVGTGSGCIAVALAHGGGPGWRGCAVDASRAALAVAARNVARHGVAERVALAASDLLACFPEAPLFDLVVSNPPYVAEAEAAALPAVVRDHEPRAALFGGPSGLDVFARLLPEASLRLVPGGTLVVELGAGQAATVAAMAEGAGLRVDAVHPDLQGIARCLVARRPD
jgi:release factor glutamine methyltransferase